MSDKTYDRIVNALLLVAIACSLLSEKHKSWWLALGCIAIAAALGAILLHFLNFRTPRPLHAVLGELAQGLQDGSIVLKKTAHISVTQAIIDKDGHHCTNCPVFNAMVAAGAPVKAVQIWTWKDKKNRYRSLPEQVGAWIYRYDSFDGTPQPIEFDVEWEA